MSPWGLGVGCDFVNKPCLISEQGDPLIPEYSRGFFCNSESKKGCSPEHSTKMACSVIDYQYYVPQTSIPEDFVYFLESPSLGGPEQGDYCPVFGSPYSSKTADQLDCRNPANADQFINAYE
jgi:hypothetical protein